MAGRRETRARRFKAAQELVGSAGEVFETLQEELQTWLDNMPENLQESAKAEELQTAIDTLDEILEAAEDITLIAAAEAVAEQDKEGGQK